MAASTASARRDGTVASCRVRSRLSARRAGSASMHAVCTVQCPAPVSSAFINPSLVGEDHRVKCVLTLGVCQQVPHAAALKAKAQNRTEIIPVGRQLIPVSGALQVGQRFFLPGVGRLNTEYPAFCRVKAAPKADATAPGLVAGGLRQALLPVREKARITRDAAAYRNAAQLLDTAHQAALVVILRRHKAAHRIGGIRRRRHCFPARRAGHP